jgi:beta-xylosidase
MRALGLCCAVIVFGLGFCGAESAGGATATSDGLSIGTPQVVYDGDFPDPSTLFVGGTYYAYSTNVDGENLPVMSSSDLVHWQRLGDAMAFLPSWAADLSGFTWAPSVAAAPSGGYEAFFSTLDTNGEECIGRAVAPSPTGPFLDTSPSPLICSDHQGAIDPSVFRTAAGDFLVWKADTGKDQPGEIFAQRLSQLDSSLIGSPALLLTASQGWEGGIVEGPALADIGGHLHLFFSANHWDTSHYVIGLTTCTSPLGPCDQADTHVVLSSQPGMAGPGGPDVFVGQDRDFLAFSAWTDGSPGGTGSRRALFVSVLSTGGALAAATSAGSTRTVTRERGSQ